MFDPEEDRDPGFGVSVELVEAAGAVAMPEVSGPSGKEPVEPSDDRRDGRADQVAGGEFAYSLSSSQRPPALNTLADMGNQISIRHSVPITVLDLAHITGTITVRFADGTERFHRVGTDNRVR